MFDINNPEIQCYLQSGKIESEYPASCLPTKLQTPTTKKSKLCPFEKLDMNIYEKEARMAGFRTTSERILPWLKALGTYYYEYIGKTPELHVDWVDNPKRVSRDEPLKNVTIEVNSDQIKFYKITFHIRTGFIQVLGNKLDTQFALLHIVHSLKGPIENIPCVLEESHPDTLAEHDKDHTFEKVPITIDQQVHEIDPNNNSIEHGENKNPTAIEINDGLLRIETTIVDAIQKINVFQQSMEKELNSKIQDLCTITKTLHDKQKNTEISSEMKGLQEKILNLTAEKESLRLQLKIEHNKSALNEANMDDALKHERKVISELREEMQDIIRNSSKEINFNSDQIEKKNNEIISLNRQIKDLQTQVSTLQDENLSLKAQMANMYDEHSQNITKVGQIDTHNSTEEQEEVAILIGTSNIAHIDEKRLAHSIRVRKIIAYTIQQAEQKIRELTITPKIVIMHVLTNDIKVKDPTTCVKELQSLINDVFQRWIDTTVIVSLTTPRNDEVKHHTNGQIVNAMLRQTYSSQSKVYLVDHSNMCQDGLPITDFLVEDGFHLSDKGSTQLASNIRKTIHGILGIPLPNRNRSRSRGRRGRGQGRGRR